MTVCLKCGTSKFNKKETCLKWYCFARCVLGDNFRYNFDYYVENGYNLSLGFKSQFNQFNHVAAELSGLNLIDLGVNSINMDYSDLTNQLYFQSLFVQNFVGSRNSKD
jgi:hypothetical protein